MESFRSRRTSPFVSRIAVRCGCDADLGLIDKLTAWSLVFFTIVHILAHLYNFGGQCLSHDSFAID